jgi:peptidyl-dipeptidase A
MMRFERALYRDPQQNLNELWWDFVERYQRVARPQDTDLPHWASKNHLVSAPVYYHNYLLGELLASQLTHHIMREIVPPGTRSFAGRSEVGRYLKERVFGPGARYRWDEMIERATGEPLTPMYFVEQFVSD